jgi:hypothetical protein
MTLEIVTTLVPPPAIQTDLYIGQGPAGVGLSPAAAVAAVALHAGDFVYLAADGLHKADNSYISRPAQGFVVADYAQGENATIHFAGINSFGAWTGLTIGPVWLGLNGQPRQPSLSAGPGCVQLLGYYTGNGNINFQPGLVVVLAGTQP